MFRFFKDFSKTFRVFGFFLLWILEIFQKVFKVINKLIEVTTEHQKWLKIGTNSVKSLGHKPKPSTGARSKNV